jgi:chorismate mutase
VGEDEDRLRREVDRLDREIVRLLAQRLVLAVEIGRAKARAGRPIRSLQREAEVLAEVRKAAEGLDLDPDVAERVFRVVLEESTRRQEAEGQPPP